MDIEKIIKSGIDINIMDRKTGKTALHYAAANGNEKCAEMLIKNGANLDITDNNNETPIMSAMSTGNFIVINMMPKTKLNINKNCSNEMK